MLIFLPIIFSGNLFNLSFLIKTIIGFIALCFVSSSQYIINDIKDIEKDKAHPEKKYRQIASGKIGKFPAFLISLFLLVLSLSISYKLNWSFTITVISLFLISIVYTFLLKNIIIADVLTISINFVLRAASGAFLIGVSISSWLILGIFFLALFLVIGKRHAELLFLGKKAEKIRKTLTGYTKELTMALMIIATTLLVMCYALYSFFSIHKGLIITIPFALYTIFKYFIFVLKGDKIARYPEKAITNLHLVLGSFLWTTTTFLIIYKDPILKLIGLS